MFILYYLLLFTPFYFIHYSDPQIGRNSAAEPNLALAVSQINAMVPPAHFILVAGDMGNNPENQAAVLAQWTICDSLFDLLGIPVYYAPGNNDVGYPDEGCWTPGMLQFYRDFWGSDYYSFDTDSCHIMALNSTLLDTYSSHPCYQYSLEQDSFMREDMENIQPGQYRHLFMLFHFPLYQNSPYDPNGGGVVDRPRRDTVLQYLVDGNFMGVLTGHWHYDYMNFYWPSLLQTGITTCLTDPPVGYRIVKVFGKGIETFTVLLPNPVDTLPLVNIVTADVSEDTANVNIPVSFTCAVDTVNFPEWTGLSYKWIFGDGDSSASPNTTHAYPDTGSYQVICAAYHLHDKCAFYRFNIIVKSGGYAQEGSERDIIGSPLNIRVVNSMLEFRIMEYGWVDLNLYQANGRRVASVAGRCYEKGWHRVKISGNIPSGVYFLGYNTARNSGVIKIIYLH